MFKGFAYILVSKGWNLDQTCIDHHRMLNECIANNFGEQFFINIKGIAHEDILCDNAKIYSGRGEYTSHYVLNFSYMYIRHI